MNGNSGSSTIGINNNFLNCITILKNRKYYIILILSFVISYFFPDLCSLNLKINPIQIYPSSLSARYALFQNIYNRHFFTCLSTVFSLIDASFAICFSVIFIYQLHNQFLQNSILTDTLTDTLFFWSYICCCNIFYRYRYFKNIAFIKRWYWAST